MQLRTRRLDMVWLVALAALLAPLAILGFSGLSSRYAADDYCTAGQVQAAGFFEAQSRLYVAWSGRFAATLLVTLLESIGPMAVPFLPGLVLAAWLTAATWATREVLTTLIGRMGLLASGLVATLIVFAALQTTADPPQNLYWQTGLVTYVWPLVLATLTVGWLAHVGHAAGVPWPTAVGVSFALALLAGGTSETFAAAQVTAFALACAIAYASSGRARRSRVPPTLLVGLIGALSALAIVGLAPGNTVRQETGVQTPLSIALPRALEFTHGWLRLTFARPHAIMLLLLVGVPAAMGATRQQPKPVAWSAHARVLLGALVVTAVVLLACMLPAFYALGSNPPGRAQVIPQYVLVCSLAALGWYLGAAAAARFGLVARTPVLGWLAIAGLLVLLVSGPLASAREALQQIGPARAYAAAWDELDREVRAERRQGVRDVTIRALPATGLVQNLDFVGPNRGDWFNECVARYYDLNTIASTLSVP